MTVQYGGETISPNEDGSYTIIIRADATEIVVTNHKDGTPDTGIALDTVPYIVILVILAGAAAAFIYRRRRA